MKLSFCESFPTKNMFLIFTRFCCTTTSGNLVWSSVRFTGYMKKKDCKWNQGSKLFTSSSTSLLWWRVTEDGGVIVVKSGNGQRLDHYMEEAWSYAYVFDASRNKHVETRKHLF